MDFREGKKVAKEIGADYKPLKLAGGYDHNWVLNGSGFRKAASANRKRQVLRWKYIQTFRVYSSILAISWQELRERKELSIGRLCICFETQYFPDAIHKII